MLHVNEDTGDEIFRRAADDYLLKEGNPDWESLICKIDTNKFSQTSDTSLVNKKKLRFLSLISPGFCKNKWRWKYRHVSWNVGLGHRRKKKINFCFVLHEDADAPGYFKPTG